ncbi:MAG TPA: hypothetical protein VHH88_09900, partial [Verrucomicrobiae bacterium]|nr:hypothetical protein [Verrucomicrobiae bacterium]
MNQTELQNAFAKYDRQTRISNSKLGAVLAMILMPAGMALDYFVYGRSANPAWGMPLVWKFLGLRILCSVLV